MSDKFVMALDQGTTSSRAIIFNKAGEIVSKSQNEFTQYYPQNGWVEHDPNEILFSVIQAMIGCMRPAGTEDAVKPDQIKGIGITNQRETTIIWDKDTGKPIYNAIVWQCRRTAEYCEELKKDGLGPYIKQTTGLLIDAYFSATKIKWILDNVEGAREKAEAGQLLFGTIDTWIIWNLTGGKAHVTDYSNACRTMLFDIDKLCWDETLCEKLEIPMSMLPEVKPSSCIYGYLDKIAGIEELAGCPIAGAIGDQPGALFGQGCFEKGQAKNTYGTGCFLLMNTGGERIDSKSNLLSGIAWGLDGKVTYDLEGSAFNAGSVIKWLRDELELIDDARECDELAEEVPDTNGLYLVPAFTGLGAPYWDMYARGIMVGITRSINKRHVCRAVLESITYQMTDLLEAMMSDSEIMLKDLRVDGGASVSDIMMQMQADMTGCNVNRPVNREATALGAAYLAGLATGVWENTAEIEENRKVDKIFVPSMPSDVRNKKYSDWKRAVERSRNWER
ncbi:MAG: glycerol kinase GlpK [Ruminococcaceae bacterium]|nr:glycerol kinase GlpK [Oscillospiraceae bacterium]